MIYFIYNLLLYTALVLLSPVWILLIIFKKKYRVGLGQKLGFFLPIQTRETIWIHAVSVGETIAATGLVQEFLELTQDYRIMFSTTTSTGQEVARQKLAPNANVFYFPYDLPCATRRTVRAIKPAVIVLIDTELWPNLIRSGKKHGAKIALVNGRISDKSFPRYHRFYWLFKYILGKIDLFAMQSENDGERIIQMGADPKRVDVPGNLKFDRSTEPVTPEDRTTLKQSLGMEAQAPVLILGSIHEGEEAAIRAAIKCRDHAPNLRIIIAPRRIEDFGWIKTALRSSGLHIVRKSEVDLEKSTIDDVIVIDTFGELANLYSICDVAFVGGSLIPHGGQNPLEPATQGITAVFGQYMGNFSEAAEALVSGGGGFQVDSEEELYTTLVELLTKIDARETSGKLARSVVERNRGASRKAAESIIDLIEK